MVSPRFPLAITATLAEDKTCGHCAETREGMRGREKQRDGDRKAKYETRAERERAKVMMTMMMMINPYTAFYTS